MLCNGSSISTVETGVKLKMYSGIELQSTMDCLLLDSRSRGRNAAHILAKLLHTFDWTSSNRLP